MEVYYLNSEGEKLDFTKPPYVPRDISELLDYEWGYESEGDGITGFTKEMAELSIVLNVFADDEETYLKACDRLFTITEKDVIKNAKGRLYYNGQYVLCNLIGSTKKDWCMGVSFHLCYMRLITDRPVWIKERKYEFVKSIDGKANAPYLDYPHDYPYDYMGDVKGTGNIINDGLQACDFKWIIYGPCTNPRIMIGGNSYEVKTVVSDREYMTIDSRENTVVRTRLNGFKVNEFNNRQKEPSIFTKIPVGNSNITWDGNFGHDLILFMERSEPERGGIT